MVFKQSKSVTFSWCYTSVARCSPTQLHVFFLSVDPNAAKTTVNISDEAHSWAPIEVRRLKEKSGQSLSRFWLPLSVCLNLRTHSGICLEIHWWEIKLGRFFFGHEKTIPHPCHHDQQKTRSSSHPGFLAEARVNTLTPGAEITQRIPARHLNLPGIHDIYYI